MTVLYSIAGLGIAIVNDFKSIEGDRQMGLMSPPVAFGVEKAKWICVGSIDATQLAVAGYLRLIGEVGYSNVLTALIFPDFLQFKFFLPDPIKNDVKYQGVRAALPGVRSAHHRLGVGAPHQQPQHVNRARRGVRGDEGGRREREGERGRIAAPIGPAFSKE